MRARRRPAVIVAAAILGMVGLASWSIVYEPDRLVVRRVTVRVGAAPDGWRPLKIAILSDIHAGSPHLGTAKLRDIAATTNALDPDVVVFLGDLVIHGVIGGRFMEPEAAMQELGSLRARYAKIAVLGNHDWWLDGPRVRAALQSTGFRVLENDALAVDYEGSRVWFAGLADLWTRDPDIKGTLGRIPDAAPIVLLTHSPDVFPDVPARVALTLAGHTHGGQVRLPGIGSPLVPSRFGQRYATGLIEEDGRRLFVTSGIGTSILPVRLGMPPEVAEVTLAR